MTTHTAQKIKKGDCCASAFPGSDQCADNRHSNHDQFLLARPTFGSVVLTAQNTVRVFSLVAASQTANMALSGGFLCHHFCQPPDVSWFQVLIRVHACGVNPVETYIRSGAYAWKPPLPYTPGADVGGVVESVGEGVTSVKVCVQDHTWWAVVEYVTFILICV